MQRDNEAQADRGELCQVLTKQVLEVQVVRGRWDRKEVELFGLDRADECTALMLRFMESEKWRVSRRC
jgi:hypothetical protein